MPDIALDLRYLRYAILAAEHGSFRRAAEILCVSQSTVSRRIQILERRVGMALFDRNRSGARITTAGEHFLGKAAIGAKHLHQAADIVRQAKRGCTGVLRVGLTACLGGGFLSELFASYHRRYPAIEVIFEEGTAQLNEGALLGGRLDLALMPTEPRSPGCRAEQLWDEAIYVAVPASHEIASSDGVRLDSVGNETFLVMTDAAGPEISNYLVRELSVYGLRPSISRQHIGFGNLLNMVEQGFGITLATKSVVGNAYTGVCFVPIIGTQEKFSFSVVWSETNQNPALQLFVDMCLERRPKARKHANGIETEGETRMVPASS